ncbi:MAG: YicC family protein [Parachlamydiales bacterium]|nr:YicC family protein [Parachlamydiales bacterium]
MLSSMTGFGRAAFDAPYGRLTVEIQSVNRKYLEIFVSSPKEFTQYEHEVRKWVGEAISRGQVSVRIFLEPSLNAIDRLLPDPKVLKRLKAGWDQVAKKAGVDAKGIDLPFLMQYLPASKNEASDEELRVCVKEAVKALVAMKQTEGKALAKDLAQRIKELERMIAEIEKHSPDATEKMRTKLRERMEEVFKGEVEERLLREVALFAERVDISEEITRFKSHIDQFKGLLKADVVGRKMDFLLQEMGREVNTIGSKSMEAKIAHLVVAMKSELEKVREQVQNIE